MGFCVITDGAQSIGGAAERINSEFRRIRRELGDISGVVSDELRLRTMLRHLTKTLHPGVLNDCFFKRGDRGLRQARQANQIQVLALRNAEIEDQTRQLHRRLADTDPDVIMLPGRS